MQCRETKELLSPYLDGAFNPLEGKAVSSHLDVCPDCRAKWLSLCEASDLLKSLPEVVPPPEFSAGVINKITAAAPQSPRKAGLTALIKALGGGQWPRALALAAALVFTFGITALMYGLPGQLPLASYVSDPGRETPPAETQSGDKDDSTFINNIYKVFPNRSETARQGGIDLAGRDLPDGPGPSYKESSEQPTTLAAPEVSVLAADALNGEPDGQVDLTDDHPAAAGLPVATKPVAVQEGDLPQAAASRYMYFADKDLYMVARATTLTLSAPDHDVALAKIKDLAETNRGFLISGDQIIIVKIPSDRYSEVMGSLPAIGEVTVLQTVKRDVTGKYAALEARVRELTGEEQRLLAAAGPGAGQPGVSDQLARVRSDLEQQRKLLQVLQNEVNYVTIKISLP